MSTARLRSIAVRIRDLAAKTVGLAAANGVPATWRRIVRYLRRRGLRGILDQADQQRAFEQWLRVHLPSRRQLDALADSTSPVTVHFSILMPVYNTDPVHLRAAVESVIGQVYTKWELCVVDDRSDRPETLSELDALSDLDPRVHVIRSGVHGGISFATNAALRMAGGEFVAFLDHDDMLPPHALATVALALMTEPQADVLYSDECALVGATHLVEPFFKPVFSPNLLLSMNYIGHLVVARSALVSQVGGLRSDYDGSQDYDLVLRLTEVTDRIVHIPDILYYWRRSSQSTSDGPEAKPYAYVSARKALQAALGRRGLAGAVEQMTPGRYRISHDGTDLSVTAIVPIRDHPELLQRCIASLDRYSDGVQMTRIIVDNGSVEPETRRLLAALAERPDTAVVRDDRTFNWSRLNNLGARGVETDALLFLNNDVEAIHHGWLTEMLSILRRPGVGVVGAKLLFSDGRIQHAGVILGGGGIAAHAFYGSLDGQATYFDYANTVRDVCAVTGACLLTDTQVFSSIGGFDDRFCVAYGDVDYCLRVRDRDLAAVWTPHARLLHLESQSRGHLQPEADAQLLRSTWAKQLRQGDPFLGPHLDPDSLSFQLRTRYENTSLLSHA